MPRCLHLLLSLSLFTVAATVFAQRNAAPAQPLKKHVIQRVECVRHPDQSYMLYLPLDYDDAHPRPIIYAFDPSARGNIPAERYEAAAARYGYIVAASNNSRNG